MKKNKIVIISLLVLINFFIFSDSINISEKTLEEYINDLKNNKKDILDTKYFWSGVIVEIKMTDNSIEASVLKGKWSGTESVESYKFIVKTDKIKFIEQINNIGLYKKIILILKVLYIKDGIIPVCEPILIKDV